MKICFFNVKASFKIGGLETSVWEMGKVLNSRGHEVTIYAGDTPNAKARYEDIRMVLFPFKPIEECLDLRSLFPSFGGHLRKYLERLSFGHSAFSALIEGEFDLVVINKPTDFSTMWFARMKGMKSHVIFRSGGKDFIFGDRLFSRACNYMASCSSYNARQIQSRYKKNVNVIFNGVDNERFKVVERKGQLRQAIGIPDNAIVLMSVGRIVVWKGLNIIVSALPSCKNIYYLVVGEGPRESQLEQLAIQHGVAERVIMYGSVEHSFLPELYPEADIFVQPSVGEEAFGISVIEAMACGLPVLASDSGGLPEVVDDGVTGKIVQSGNVKAWASAINQLGADQGLRISMGEAGARRVKSLFTWESVADRFENIVSNQK